MKNNASKIGAAFLIGGAVGAAIALLYTPQSGTETRKDISKAARRARNSTVDLIEEAIEDLDEFASDLKKKATDIIERGVDLSDKAKQEIVTTLEHGQRAIEKQRKRLTEALGL
jgi:gas vesicle protein